MNSAIPAPNSRSAPCLPAPFPHLPLLPGCIIIGTMVQGVSANYLFLPSLHICCSDFGSAAFYRFSPSSPLSLWSMPPVSLACMIAMRQPLSYSLPSSPRLYPPACAPIAEHVCPLLKSLQRLPSRSGVPCVLIFYYTPTGASLLFLERCLFLGMFAQGPLCFQVLLCGSLPPSLQVFK